MSTPKKKKQKPFKIDLSFDELIDLSLNTAPVKKKPLKKGKSKVVKKAEDLSPAILVALGIANSTDPSKE